MINPATGSRWSTEKGGKIFYITINGMWAVGSGDRFKVLSYDLKYDHLVEIQNMPADRMEQLISNRTLMYVAAPELITAL